MARGEVIRIRNEFYIRSSSARVDVRPRVLKQGDMFAVFDRFGDIETFGTGELGLYYQDTRFLSRLTLKLGKDRPLLLSSTVREDNAVLAVDATNPDVWRDRVAAKWRDRAPKRVKMPNGSDAVVVDGGKPNTIGITRSVGVAHESLATQVPTFENSAGTGSPQQRLR